MNLSVNISAWVNQMDFNLQWWKSIFYDPMLIQDVILKAFSIQIFSPMFQPLCPLYQKNANNMANENTLSNWIKSFSLSAECHLKLIPNRYADSSKSVHKNTSCAESLLCLLTLSNQGGVEERIGLEWVLGVPVSSPPVECTKRAKLIVCSTFSQLLQTYLLQK